MKHLLLLLLCTANLCLCSAQSKEELIDKIVKQNVYESESIGAGGSRSSQYTAFEKLAALLSKEELIKLTDHKNGVLRMYASASLIDNNDADPAALFLSELKRNATIETQIGCIVGYDITSSIIYHCYWNKIRMEASKGINYELNDLIEQAEKNILKTDPKMKELDSIVISTDKHVDWLIYLRAFENNNFSPGLLPTIEKLGFQKNNPYAIAYLTTNYPDVYKQRAYEYYTGPFVKIKFDNGELYFHEFLELLLKTGNKKIQQIAIDAFRNSQYTRETWFKNTFKEYNVKI